MYVINFEQKMKISAKSKFLKKKKIVVVIVTAKKGFGIVFSLPLFCSSSHQENEIHLTWN